MEAGWDTSTMVAVNSLVYRFYVGMPALCFIFGLSILVPALCAASPEGTQKPLWSNEAVQDLSKARNSHAPLLFDRSRAGVTFLDDKQLIVHEVQLDGGEKPSLRESEVSNPFALHASILDTNSGKSLLSRDWPTSIHNSSVDAVNGGILIRTGVTLRWLTEELADVRDITFRENDRGFHWDLLTLRVSPSGGTLMVNRINQNANESYLEVFGADTSNPKYSWKQSPALYHLYSISDDGIAAADLNQDGLMRASFGSVNWKKSGNKFKPGCLNLPTFIAKDRLVVQACRDLLLIDKEGQPDLLYRLGETESLTEKIAFSSDGRFVALSVSDVEVKKHILSEQSSHTVATHIAVYDVSAKRSVLTVSVTPLPRNDYDFALSPDGSKLAVLRDRNVTVYSVPAH